ncbi:phosphoadenosine phosphosulfate reductase domain-containing protein [Granulosicoccus sp. 3-233]|uniref:phosphoadenosine phosphosulfate reductase domain-containing protein n=1 Tax=Granulosicoccus sp. 3-233 TaxID=3417969 RepID=UPI003D32BB3A
MVSDTREELNYRHQLATARNAIHVALENSCRPIVSTKFSEESAVFLHLVTQVKADIPVVWVDTGYNTRATRAFADELHQRLDLNLKTYEPHDHTITFPPALDDPEHAEFTHEVKIEPFQRALQELQADGWLSSIRRYQSAHRSKLPTFHTASNGLLKASPILEWTADTVARYRLEHDLPEGPSCFDPTKGEAFRECGLHLSA